MKNIKKIKDKIGIIGAGGLGTALAQSISNNVDEIFLFCKREEIKDDILLNGYNKEYYPYVKLSKKINPINDILFLEDANIIFLCVPSSEVRNISKIIRDKLTPNILVSTSKGIEYPSLKTMSQIIYEETNINPVVMSGPNFASEIIINQPTVTCLSSKNKYSLRKISSLLSTDNFLIEENYDVIGTEYCGFLKNVYAIAFGVCIGLHLNENALASIITKSYKEMRDIILKCGGDKNTLDSFSGLGDLFLTCTSNNSRNHALGLLYGQKIISEYKNDGVLFEGIKSLKTTKLLCEKFNINECVVSFVYNILINKIKPEIAFTKMWWSISK